MSNALRALKSLALFCKVVDNYGDIGISWRFALQLHEEHGIDVTLWVDDLRTFRRIRPDVDINADAQDISGVHVRHWPDQNGMFAPSDIADIVVEFFAVDIPPAYIAAMAQCVPKPVWFNLEGLTAEEWVEGCHTLPSSHPQFPLTKYFFFPGFTGKTGGLLREASLLERRRAFQSEPAAASAFLSTLGVTAAEMSALKVSLFCYPHAPVSELFGAWQQGAVPVTCLVPEGVAVDAVRAFVGTEVKAGAVGARGALTVRVIPFVAQPDYDRLLWSCDLNFVRGEDSFVRAQWAGKPFVWHIYHQDENLHHKKLRAFLGRYSPDIESLFVFSLGWNGALEEAGLSTQWPLLHADLSSITQRAVEWECEMLNLGDFTSNILQFARSHR